MLPAKSFGFVKTVGRRLKTKFWFAPAARRWLTATDSVRRLTGRRIRRHALTREPKKTALVKYMYCHSDPLFEFFLMFKSVLYG